MENPSAKEIWDKASQLIKSEINGISYDSWFKDIVPVSFDGQVLTLLVNIEFIRNMLRNNYDQLIQAALMQAAGEPVRYVVRIPSEMNAPREEAPARPSAAASMLNPKYTFSTYVIGKSNNFAHAAAYAVSQSPGDTYNPLFLYSGVGLGKTHLMHAIGHAILEKNPQSRILYITSETFTNDLINAISSNTNSEFRNRYRNVDVLMVDDIQFIAGKEQTQEEFFHTFNALYEARKQIVISSDKPPKDIPTLEERLRSRFEWGLIADISKPDLETRIAILRKKAELENLDVPDEVNAYIASKVESNIRELEGCLTRVLGLCQGQRRRRARHRGARGRGPAGHAPRQGPAPHHHRPHHGHRRGILLGLRRGPQVQAPQPGDHRSPPDRHVPYARTQRRLAAAHRPGIRRPRPHHRHPRLRQGRRGHEARRRAQGHDRYAQKAHPGSLSP